MTRRRSEQQVSSSLMRQGALAASVALGLVFLAACDEDEEASRMYACEKGAPEEWDSCYDYTHEGVHCTVEQLRDYYADGRFDLEDLPRWALREERNGAPIIYDVRAKELPLALGKAWGQLESWAKRHYLPINSDAMTRCALGTTEEDMRAAEGGGRGTTEWPSATPSPTS